MGSRKRSKKPTGIEAAHGELRHLDESPENDARVAELTAIILTAETGEEVKPEDLPQRYIHEPAPRG